MVYRTVHENIDPSPLTFHHDTFLCSFVFGLSAGTTVRSSGDDTIGEEGRH